MKIVKEKLLVKGRIFNLVATTLKGDQGTFYRETVVHPGAVAILPVISKDNIILIRQYRFATRGYLWEIPAGTLEKGESPLVCARRELIEETGYAAGRLQKINAFFSSPGFCTEKIHLFRAMDLKLRAQKLDPDEQIECKIFSRSQIKDLIAKNRIIDAKTLIGLMIWLQPEKT